MIDPPPVSAAIAPDATGRGIQVALVDSGINFSHPHLALPRRGVTIDYQDGSIVTREDDVADRFGHGTCCAALIHALAPDAALIAIRVMTERFSTDVPRLARGITAAVEQGANIVCVPSGARAAGRDLVEAAVREALAAGAWIVAPLPAPDVFPGCLDGVLGVGVQDGVDVAQAGGHLVADGRARGLPRAPDGRTALNPAGRPNFYGPSLSAARVAAALARWIEAEGDGARALDRALGFRRALPLI